MALLWGCALPAALAAATPDADAETARQRLRVAPGLQVTLWAGEPLVQNITSVAFDGLGRAYVVETGRRRTSVFDIRNFRDWVPDDLALRTVEERASFLERMLKTNAAFLAAATRSGRNGFGDFNGDDVVDVRDLEVESERVRLVWDADRDGRADSATTFADNFRTSVSGVAAGVLAQGNHVWFTCIPDLWRFEAAPPPDPRSPRGEVPPTPPRRAERLLHGFGVHIAYGGHDLHGLIRGPDGRLYFTIADRGATVTLQDGRVLSAPDAGSVFRCEPDGSRLQLFATGLRNPQELAFDEFGNLWTGDNNGDGGDQARWTLVLEGADYGWTIGWQWLPGMGAWNAERLWHTRESNTAASIVPPVAHIGHGPAGIAYYPGTGLGDRFEGTFFYADFPGGVRTFRVEPDGAFFKIAPPSSTGPEEPLSAAWLQDNSATNLTGKLLWDLYPVDVAFPPDGGVVVADWVEGWEKTGKGRLWRVTDPALAADPAIAETARLLAEGMGRRRDRDLAALLGHRDFRVRLEAQWALAERGRNSWATLTNVALHGADPRARRHAIWGLGQLARAGEKPPKIRLLSPLMVLLDDPDPEIQGQAARMLGGAQLLRAQWSLQKLIAHADPRLSAQAMLAYRDLFSAFSVDERRPKPPASLYPAIHRRLPEWARRRLPPLRVDDDSLFWPDIGVIARIEGGAPADPVLAHAARLLIACMGGMAGGLTPNLANFWTYLDHPDPDVRLCILLAGRTLAEPAIRQSLNDPDPRLVLEAARAIHDVPVPAAMPDLAALLEVASLEALIRKSGSVDPPGDGGSRSELRFTGDEWLAWILRRSVNAAFRLGGEIEAARLVRLSAHPEVPESVRLEALMALGAWAEPPSVDRVVGLHRPISPRDPGPAREALAAAWEPLVAHATDTVLRSALDAADALQWPGFPGALQALLTHPDPATRAEAERRLTARSRLPVAALQARAESGPMASRQQALRALADAPGLEAVVALEAWAARWRADAVPAALQLEVLEALTARLPNAAVQTGWTNSWPAGDPLAPFRVALEGGDAGRGRRLFAERADWGCQRCHKLGGEGGDVGPDLTGIGRLRGREEVLRSILYPNDAIAEGHETVVVTLHDESVILGVVREETPDRLALETPEEGRVLFSKADIRSRERGLSAMPEGLGELMTLGELRDLVEALSE